MRTKKEKNTTSIPRPPNPFILYRKDRWHSVKNDPRHADLRQADLSKVFGDAWRAESEVVKLEYQRRAAECKAEHTRLYPDYKYAPQQKKKKEKRTRNGRAADESRYDWGIPAKDMKDNSSSQAPESAGPSTLSNPRARPRTRTATKAIAMPLLFTQRVARRLNGSRKREPPLSLGLELSPEGLQPPPPLARMKRATNSAIPSVPAPILGEYSHPPQLSSGQDDPISAQCPPEPSSPPTAHNFSFNWFDNINAPFPTATDSDSIAWLSDPVSQHQPSAPPTMPATQCRSTSDVFDVLWEPSAWPSFDMSMPVAAPSQPDAHVPFNLEDAMWNENWTACPPSVGGTGQGPITSASTKREGPQQLTVTFAPQARSPKPTPAPLSVVTNTYNSWQTPNDFGGGWRPQDAAGLYATIEEIER